MDRPAGKWYIIFLNTSCLFELDILFVLPDEPISGLLDLASCHVLVVLAGNLLLKKLVHDVLTSELVALN